MHSQQLSGLSSAHCRIFISWDFPLMLTRESALFTLSHFRESDLIRLTFREAVRWKSVGMKNLSKVGEC